MFYSHDLLGRKTPLGAIWTLAHGRRLSKGKIISINLRELCDEILQPGVPHSLRLQGILIGGLVIVFSKQQSYLLDDLQEMMRRLTAAGKSAVPFGAAAGAAEGAGAAKGKKGRGKQAGNQQANLEAITMMDMEDLLAPAALGGDDILGILDGGSLSEALASSGGLLGLGARGARGGAARQEELGDDLFMMGGSTPTSSSLGPATTSEGGGHPHAGRAPAGGKPSSRTRTTGQQHTAEEEVYGGMDTQQREWLQNPEDEMFDLHADFDLLGGMDVAPLGGAAAAVAAAAAAGPSATASQSTVNRQQQQRQQQRQQREAPYGDDAFMMQDALEDMQDTNVDVDVTALLSEEQQQQQSDEQQGRDQDSTGDAADGRGRQAATAKQKKMRRGGSVIVDDLDNLVIRSKLYREWCTDASPIVNRRVKEGRGALSGPATPVPGGPLVLPAHSVPAAAPFSSAAGFGAGPLATFGAGPLAAGVPMDPELLQLFRAPSAGAGTRPGAAGAGAAARGGSGKLQRAPSSPEVNNSTGNPPAGAGGDVLWRPLDLRPVRGVSGADHLQQQQQLGDDDLLLMPDESYPAHPLAHEQEHELLSNDEAHDRLGDLPFNGDMEVERMRAAATPGSSDGSLRHHLPGSIGTGARAKAPGTTDTSSAGGSSLLAQGRDGSGLKRRLGSADLGNAGDLDIFFGGGNLADLLPDVQLEQQLGDELDGDEEEPGDRLAGSGHGRAAGSLRGLVGSDGRGSGRLTPYSSSQFPLLEETEPDGTQAGGAAPDQLSHTTRVALSIFDERLRRAAQEQAAAAGGGAGVAEPHVSFFGLLKEGQLSRNQAATLFYQTCVTTTAGFIRVAQDRPFGDILIQAGHRPAAV